jgi:hypothetical protein
MNDMEQHAVMKKMESDLRHYKIQQVEGYFMGHKEISFMVSGVERVQPILELAKLYNQDSIMYVSSYGGAMIVSTDAISNAEFIGEFKVSKTKPKGGDYSYNPRTQDYYIVEDLT